MKTSIMAVVVGGTVVLGGGIQSELSDESGVVRAVTAPSDEKRVVAPRDELDCRETADEYENKGRIYLYTRSSCDGANDAWDDDNDSDYGDGKGRIKKFDNRADSIVNTTKRNVEFYNLPGYKGKSFCVRPGEYVHRLFVYGDGSGTNHWWSNSISSHRFVSAGSCDRWFGWRVT